MGSDYAEYSRTRTIVGDARSRILDALVQVVAERGYRDASVGLVVARARVSRRTFYEQFDGLEDCFAAVLDLGLTLPSELILRAFMGEKDWRDGVRAALAALLEFFDSEPLLTRVWFGEVLAVGAWALEHRERNITTMSALIVGHWFPDGSGQADEVLVRGVMSSVLGALTSHVVAKRPEPMVTLLGPLTRLVASPFLTAEAVEEEVERAAELAQTILARRSPTLGGHPDPPTSIPAALLLPGAHRSRQCLHYFAEQAGQGVSPSNHQVGKGLGIAHQSQTSKLLSRLQGMGLLIKQQGAPGHPNAWTLTPEGERVAQALAENKRTVAD